MSEAAARLSERRVRRAALTRLCMSTLLASGHVSSMMSQLVGRSAYRGDVAVVWATLRQED